jgi:hypothetical protein
MNAASQTPLPWLMVVVKALPHAVISNQAWLLPLRIMI